MRIQRPQLPVPPAKDTFSVDLVFKLKQIIASIIDQLNRLTEGHIAAVTNAQLEPPNSELYQVGDYVRNSYPVEQGTRGARYVVKGWICVADGVHRTFVEDRCLTGN
ncbi:hypothetical protein KQH60_08080 [Mycetohabitans sp. B8]|uniref:hypothetical protein n=1 Tax=Mycetohabitans sp. B8 TaxID=2841845 RepID=UPI001F360F48|nr:hypothetical protein [Mycetohabitans sp. B8]MCG1042504.1 hypothetical protein [Mycetohabitans sp. B8]